MSTEDRWIAAPRIVLEAGRLGHHTLFRLTPSGLGYHQAVGRALMGKQSALAHELFGSDGEEHALFERHQAMFAGTRRFIDSAGANILIDISCLPKRFFFPIIKLVTEQSTAVNIVVAYTHAAQYASTLSEDPEPESPLPMFMGALPRDEASSLIVSAGAESLGLSQVLEAEGGFRSIRVLYPYPAPPPLGRRNAEFLRQMAQSVDMSPNNIVGIDPNDVPQTYARLQHIGGSDPAAVTLAPYGPKPVSLAMCLYVLSLETELRPTVIYTQPKCYNPEYSMGIAQRDERDHVAAYVIRLAGHSLYRAVD